MRIPNQYSNLIFSFLMSFIMAFCMSGVLTAINLGISPEFIWQWMNAFSKAVVIAFPLVLFLAPIVRRFTQTLIVPEEVRQ